MANEVLNPTSTTATDVNLSGSHLTVDDDPDAQGGDWRAASSNNATSIAAHGFNTPTGNPTAGAGLQNFKIYARLTANASSCTYNVYLSESGTRLNAGAAIATGSLTSTTGQLITAAWDATLLGTADGSLVECEFEVVKSGGSPASRTSGEVDAVEWNVDYSTVTIYYQTITATRTRTTSAATSSIFSQLIAATRTRTSAIGKKTSKIFSNTRTRTSAIGKTTKKIITVTVTRLASVATKFVVLGNGVRKKLRKIGLSIGLNI